METAHLTNRPTWTLRFPHGRSLTLGGRPRVMGILNLTPDSFSDGGLWIDPLKATERALRMLAEGADLLDLGAESTRPGGGVYGAGAAEVPAEEEIARLFGGPLPTPVAIPTPVQTQQVGLGQPPAQQPQTVSPRQWWRNQS